LACLSFKYNKYLSSNYTYTVREIFWQLIQSVWIDHFLWITKSLFFVCGDKIETTNPFEISEKTLSANFKIDFSQGKSQSVNIKFFWLFITGLRVAWEKLDEGEAWCRIFITHELIMISYIWFPISGFQHLESLSYIEFLIWCLLNHLCVLSIAYLIRFGHIRAYVWNLKLSWIKIQYERRCFHA